MKERSVSWTGCIPLTIIAILLVIPSPGTSIEMDQGDWQRPSIDSVEISLRNATGVFSLAFTATGSAPAGTETVNVTFGTLNGTELQLVGDLWFKEGNLMILGNGMSLEGEGNSTEPWSEWTFKVRVNLPYNGDLMAMIEAVQWMLPEGIDNSTLGDFEFDPANIARTLAEMNFYFVARAFNDTEAWGQEALDITAQVQTAVLQFMIDEGFIDSFVNGDDDDVIPADTGNDGKKEVSQGLLVALGIGGIVMLIAAVIIAIYLLTTRSRKL